MPRLQFVSTPKKTIVILLPLLSIVAWSQPPFNDKAIELNQRGVAHLSKKEYDAAIKFFREALEVKPTYPDALDNLGKALEAEGKDAEATSDLNSRQLSRSVQRAGSSPVAFWPNR